MSRKHRRRRPAAVDDRPRPLRGRPLAPRRGARAGRARAARRPRRAARRGARPRASGRAGQRGLLRPPCGRSLQRRADQRMYALNPTWAVDRGARLRRRCGTERSRPSHGSDGERRVLLGERRAAEEPVLDREPRGFGIDGSRPRLWRNSSSKNSASPGSKIGRIIGVLAGGLLDLALRDRVVEDRFVGRRGEVGPETPSARCRGRAPRRRSATATATGSASAHPPMK